MSAKMAQDDDEAQYTAVDPSDIEKGDEIIVDSIHWDDAVRGVVQEVTVEAGRYGIKLIDDPDGLGKIVRIWEESGRTWMRVED